MQKQAHKIFSIITIGLMLQGCVSTLTSVAMMGMEGNGACPPGIHIKASRTMATLSSLQAGADAARVYNLLGQPEEKHNVYMQNGDRLTVWKYRTGHGQCRGLPTKQTFTPVVISQNQLIGAGDQFYRKYISPSIERDIKVVSASDSFGSFMEFAIYPFNKAF